MYTKLHHITNIPVTLGIRRPCHGVNLPKKGVFSQGGSSIVRRQFIFLYRWVAAGHAQTTLKF